MTVGYAIVVLTRMGYKVSAWVHPCTRDYIVEAEHPTDIPGHHTTASDTLESGFDAVLREVRKDRKRRRG